MEKLPPIILGSSSPRREEILRFFSIPFQQVPSQFDEDSIHFTGDAKLYVTSLAQKKAEVLRVSYPDAIILTADTTVACREKIYNKPKSREEAFCFLSELSGTWHSVFTGICLAYKESLYVLHEETKILFHALTERQINLYLDKINFLDKAGAYAIQQGGSILVKKIEGCYYNVMGLPLTALKELFTKVGIDLWQHLKIL
jgi:septum formation protein